MSVKRLALIVSGDRTGTRTPATRLEWELVLMPVLKELRERYDDVVLIHGSCGESADGTGTMKGIDAIADRLGRFFGFTVVPMPADWSRHGGPAGPIRNLAMDAVQANLSRVGYDELTIGCHDWIQGSKGTRHMVRLSEKRGVPVRLVTTEEAAG